MNQVTTIDAKLCILCSENPPDSKLSSSNDKHIENILLGLIQFWDIKELTVKEIALVSKFLSCKENVRICLLCSERILNYDQLLQKVKAIVAKFGSQFKTLVQNFEQHVSINEKSESGLFPQENAPRKSNRKRNKRKGK